MNLSDVASLSDADLAGLWKKVGLDVPAELVEETVRRGDRMISHLGPILVDDDLWCAEDAEGWAPVHALMLLQAIGGPQVAHYAVDVLGNGMGEDWLTEDGANLVFAMGPDAMKDVWAIVMDEGANEGGRATAIDGLAMLGLAHEHLRADIIVRMRSLTDAILEKRADDVDEDYSAVLDACLDALASLHDEPSKERIERAFADDRFDLWSADKADLLDLYDTPFEKMLNGRRRDPLDHFKPENLRDLGNRDLSPYEDDDTKTLPFVRPAEKVGRNDPCPCGSGKKYKKCCMPR